MSVRYTYNSPLLTRDIRQQLGDLPVKNEIVE